jgi:hypothetical protein
MVQSVKDSHHRNREISLTVDASEPVVVSAFFPSLFGTALGHISAIISANPSSSAVRIYGVSTCAQVWNRTRLGGTEFKLIL